MKQSDKESELEKQVSRFRGETAALRAQVTARGTRVEALIKLRPAIRGLLQSTHNALLCSTLYSDDSFHRQLARAKDSIRELAELNEQTITSRFKRTETANAKLTNLVQQVPLRLELAADGYTGYLDERQVVPVYYLRYSAVPDVAGFVHPSYNIWFKSGREFSTGFISWPTASNWRRVTAQRELLPALTAAVREDGLIS